MIQDFRVSGRNFTYPNGQRRKYVGYGNFAGFRRWRIHPDPDVLVGPILDQVRAAAVEGGLPGDYPIVMRTFGYAQPSNQFSVPPWPNGPDDKSHFVQMRAMTEYYAERNFHIGWTVGDAQVVLPTNPPSSMGDQDLCQRWWNEATGHLVDLPGVNIETCNQWYKNGIDLSVVKPYDFSTLNRFLITSGYYADSSSWDKSLDLMYCVFHNWRDTRDLPLPWFTSEANTSGAYLSAHGKPMVFEEPIGAWEVEKPGSRYNNPMWAYLIGQGISYAAGVTFHNELSFSGDGYDKGPITRECAVAFFAGVASVVNDPRYGWLP